MHKDFGLIDDLARESGAFMPATAIAAQLNAAEAGKEREEEFSAVAEVITGLRGPSSD